MWEASCGKALTLNNVREDFPWQIDVSCVFARVDHLLLHYEKTQILWSLLLTLFDLA